jgi:GGDEF domain-containing protein
MCTEMKTRSSFEELCRKQAREMNLNGSNNAVVLLDIDNYIYLNVVLNKVQMEAVTDEIEKKLLEFENKDTIIASMFRGSYIIAIHHLDSLETLRERCEKLHQALQLPELFGEKITVSIGAAISDNELDRGYRGAANLAFKALDEAGAKGNSVCIYHDHQADIS